MAATPNRTQNSQDVEDEIEKPSNPLVDFPKLVDDLVKAKRVKFGPDFFNSLSKKVNRALFAKLMDFLVKKMDNPQAMFSKNDTPFKNRTGLEGFNHAHMVNALNLVYTLVDGKDKDNKPIKIIKLYGVYSHEELGTGNPPNANRQKSMGERFNNMIF